MGGGGQEAEALEVGVGRGGYRVSRRQRRWRWGSAGARGGTGGGCTLASLVPGLSLSPADPPPLATPRQPNLYASPHTDFPLPLASLSPLPLQASLQVAMRLEEDITDVQGQVAVRAQAEQARSKVGVRMRPTLLVVADALPLSLYQQQK